VRSRAGASTARADVAAHDLNYVAESGMLGLAAGADGAPVVPAALVADIGGGTYPAVINILLALRERDRTGEGCKLDVAMADNLFTFMYWAIGNGHCGRAVAAAGRRSGHGGQLHATTSIARAMALSRRGAPGAEILGDILRAPESAGRAAR
jgi:alpha-methylacyl-CoA racemase